MKANIVAIGNSQGIRIPQILLDQSGLSGEVDLEVCDQGIMIRKSTRPRENWDEAFQQMAQNNDDDMLIEGSSPKTLRENWRW